MMSRAQIKNPQFIRDSMRKYTQKITEKKERFQQDALKAQRSFVAQQRNKIITEQKDILQILKSQKDQFKMLNCQ